MWITDWIIELSMIMDVYVWVFEWAADYDQGLNSTECTTKATLWVFIMTITNIGYKVKCIAKRQGQKNEYKCHFHTYSTT